MIDCGCWNILPDGFLPFKWKVQWPNDRWRHKVVTWVLAKQPTQSTHTTTSEFISNIRGLNWNLFFLNECNEHSVVTWHAVDIRWTSSAPILSGGEPTSKWVPPGGTFGEEGQGAGTRRMEWKETRRWWEWPKLPVDERHLGQDIMRRVEPLVSRCRRS